MVCVCVLSAQGICVRQECQVLKYVWRRLYRGSPKEGDARGNAICCGHLIDTMKVVIGAHLRSCIGLCDICATLFKAELPLDPFAWGLKRVRQSSISGYSLRLSDLFRCTHKNGLCLCLICSAYFCKARMSSAQVCVASIVSWFTK